MESDTYRVTQALWRSARQKMEIPVSVLAIIRWLATRADEGARQDARGDVLREPFPYEDTDENGPEEDATLLLEEDALSTVHGVEELDLGHEEGVDGPGGVDEVVAVRRQPRD